MGSQLSAENFQSKRHGGSLYFRLTLPFGITLLLAMLAAWVIAVQLLTSTIDRRLDDQLRQATATLANGQFPFTPELLSRLDQLIGARIAVLDASGAVQLATGDEESNKLFSIPPESMPDMRGGQVALLDREAGDSAWRLALQPLARKRDDRYRYVVAAASLAQTRQAARDAAFWLGAAMLVATVLLALLASFLTRSITRPVSDLARMADRIAEGQRNVSSTFTANNEIGLLAHSLNRMAMRLTEYEAEIARQNRMAGLGDLAARLAHEIRNPLTAIKMQLQLLQENVPDEDAERVHRLLNEIRRMELIVKSALTLAAPLALHCSQVRVETLITELAELLAPALEHRNIELQTAVGPGPALNIDADRIKQVLLNLINNAADELHDGGIVRVSAPKVIEANTVDLCVEDSGPGMRPDDAASPPNKPFGLGLGLTICREIVEQHGGELLQDASTDLGGARFIIRLPQLIIDDPTQAY